MMLASSSDSSASKRMPLTVPAVPTGMKTGVSIRPRRVVNTPARASPNLASILKLSGFMKIFPANGQRRKEEPQLSLCAFAGKLLVLLNDPERRREEIKLLTQTIQQVSLVRKMQSRLAPGRENHERRWPHTCLRQILNLEPRHPCTRLRNRFLEEIVELRSRHTPRASLVSPRNQRQNPFHTLTRQRRDRDHRRPFQKLHLFPQVSLKLRRRVRLLVLHNVPFIDRDDDRTARIHRVTRDRRIKRNFRSGVWRTVSIASRVVPATGETITRSSPRMRLSNDDFPTFGRPTIASRSSRSTVSSACS